MKYYLCEVVQVRSLDLGTVNRPALADHMDDWNTYQGYNAQRGKVLVACDPASRQQQAIDADPRCDFLVRTNETFETITKRIAVTSIPLSSADRTRLEALGAPIRVDLTGAKTTEEGVRRFYHKMRAR